MRPKETSQHKGTKHTAALPAAHRCYRDPIKNLRLLLHLFVSVIIIYFLFFYFLPNTSQKRGKERERGRLGSAAGWRQTRVDPGGENEERR